MKSLRPKTNIPAETLNHFFPSISKSLSSGFSGKNQAITGFRYPNSMVLQKTDCDEIRSIIIKMKKKKSTRHDCISNEVLKLCSPIIEPYLIHAINKTIETQCFPECLKVAKLMAFFEKDDT